MKGNFRIIMIIVFMAAAIFGIMVFSGAIPIGNDTTNNGATGTVTLWGTVKAGVMAPLIENFNATNQTFIVNYVQKYAETFDQDLLEALASGNGPDMFFLSDDLAYKYSNKIYMIPYQTYPLASFKNTFAGAGEVFLTSKGLMAFPLSIDPMVMYYNRSILNANAIVYPPATWDEFQNLNQIITKKDDAGKIIKSTVALGQYSNIASAKDILATLFMQVGNAIVFEQPTGGFVASLGGGTQQGNLSAILKFFTDFSDPLKNTYSWNKSLPSSTDAFSAENLAFYFGYASELSTLINKNPNEDFLVAPMPQLKNANIKVTSARVTGVAISSFSKNFNTAFTAASLMATGPFASGFANATMVAPARRDLLNVKLTDAYFPIFYSSALYGKTWLDPSPNDTDSIFRGMVDGVLSNNMTADQAITDAGAKLNLLLR